MSKGKRLTNLNDFIKDNPEIAEFFATLQATKLIFDTYGYTETTIVFVMARLLKDITKENKGNFQKGATILAHIYPDMDDSQLLPMNGFFYKNIDSYIDEFERKADESK